MDVSKMVRKFLFINNNINFLKLLAKLTSLMGKNPCLNKYYLSTKLSTGKNITITGCFG